MLYSLQGVQTEGPARPLDVQNCVWLEWSKIAEENIKEKISHQVAQEQSLIPEDLNLKSKKVKRIITKEFKTKNSTWQRN